MELIFALRTLGRHKLLVLLGVLAAGAAGYKMYKSTPPVTSTVAWTRVILDAPKSALVDVDSETADQLPWRAELVAATMATDSARADVAARMHLPADQVDVIDPTLVHAPIPASVPEAASRAAAITPAPYVITPSVPNPSIPMIALEFAAPDAAGAERLAQATVGFLKQHGTKTGRFKTLIYSGGGKDEYERYSVVEVAPIQTDVSVTTEAPGMAAAAAAFVFLGWCACIVLIPAVRQRLRRPVEARPSTARS
jgi:hypothetical protein